MTLIKNDGTPVKISVPQFSEILNPEAPEAQEIFRMAEAEDLRQRTTTILRNYLNSGANRKDLNEAGFENIVFWNDNVNQHKLHQVCINYVGEILKTEDYNKVLILYGEAGRGKTYFALSTIKYFCHAEKPRLTFTKKVAKEDPFGNVIPGQYDVYQEDAGVTDFHRGYYTTSEHLCKVSDHKFKQTSQISNDKASVDLYKKCELLVIDEVGRAMQTQKIERDVLFSVINYRISNYRPTIICSNLNEDELSKLFGDALWSRITSVGTTFCVNGLDNMRAVNIQKILKYKRNAKI